MDLSKPKLIKNGIIFNLIINNIYILGFRVINGFIFSPSSYNHKTNKYYPVCFLTIQEAELLYDSLVEKGWQEEYGFKLRTKSESINDLIISARDFSVYYG